MRLITPKVLKKRNKTVPVSSKSFFSLSLELQRSANEKAGWCRYRRSSVFDRRQKFGESVARADGVVELTMALKWVRASDIQSPK